MGPGGNIYCTCHIVELITSFCSNSLFRPASNGYPRHVGTTGLGSLLRFDDLGGAARRCKICKQTRHWLLGPRFAAPQAPTKKTK